MNRAPVAFAVACAFAIAIAGCGSNQPPGSGARPGGPTGPGVSGPLSAPGTFGAGPTASSEDLTPIELDASLLDFLPTSIDGTPVHEDLDVAAEALQDTALPRIATTIDAAVAVDAATGNLVTAWIVRLKPGAFGDEAYRQWRDSYDQGACNAAGGIVGRAQATLGGRDTYVTSCVAALRTYHVWLQDQGVLISASSIGEGRYGEKLMSALRLPGATAASPLATP